ncbi:MAG: ABC transporter ATP-binding protein [Clostridia bacterium]|nr:ABC transporter ATP-binding protein [Clostridia bacterium]
MAEFGIPPRRKRLEDGIKKPERLRDYPAYFWKKTTGFLFRLFYIIGLVWAAAPIMLVLMALLCVLDGVLPVLGAYISKDILNEVAALIGVVSKTGDIENEIFVQMQPVITLFIIYFVYTFVKKILGRLNSMVTAIAGEKVSNHIKMNIITKARDVDLRSFDDPDFYEKLENANREAGMRPLHILSATFNVISSVISAVSFVVVLATLSPIAPLLIICAAVPGAIVNYVYRNRNFQYMRRHSKERREMMYYSGLMVNKDMAKEIKLLGLGDTFIGKYKSVFERYYKGIRSLIVREGVTQVIVAFLSVLANCALFVYIAYNIVFEGGMIGDYSLYTGALTSISSYVSTLLTATATIYEGTLFINNLIDFTKEEVTVVPTVKEPIKPNLDAPHTIELRNVSFSYPGTDRRVIDNVSLTLNPAESVVLVGLNGAGKTTLIKLITRLYDPTEGEILLDGRDIREYDVAALHNMFGIVFQDFGKYAESAKENIVFGDINRNYTDEEVVAAAVHGNSDGFISELPDGYNTPLTRIFEENGIELSGGQWQKLSVSRAFYKKSEILILDEPTASLDAIAEQEIFNQFRELSRGKITVFVSHRLSSAVDADKIVVLEYGKVVEEGNHEELMQKKGKYHTLFTTQASRYQSAMEESDCEPPRP